MVYGTDGGIAPSGLVVLDDDKGVQPVYQPAPIIREEVLKKNPQIETLLKPVFEKLDLVTLQDLNGRVQVGGEPAKAVAEDFLKKERLPEVSSWGIPVSTSSSACPEDLTTLNVDRCSAQGRA